MPPPAIRVEGLGKQYQIGARQNGYRTFREAVMGLVGAPLRRLKRLSAQAAEAEMFWALRDVSFEVLPGEVIGIIGRNGAGKSTLLKILSRITEPTTGQVEIRGRVGSLLEVGTGFHPELTGRENIFLNGAILGMSRAEVKRQFDEIVDFSGVEQFLDTPVKRYSSGMHVRLAFAVAAHLEPEILIIDEVLAVGDVEFQRKCLGKMNDAARSGRTVLFVSHNMPAVESLCTTAVLLERGELVELGPTADVIRLYQRTAVAATDTTCSLIDHSGRGSDANPLMRSVTLRDSQGHTTSSFRMGASLSVEVEFKAPRPLSPVLGIVVKTDVGAAVFGVDNRMVSGFCFDDGVTNGTIVCQIDDLPLSPATYWLDLYLGDRHRSLDRIRDAIPFEVLAADVFGSGKVPPRHCGPICWPAVWELRSGSPATEAALVD